MSGRIAELGTSVAISVVQSAKVFGISVQLAITVALNYIKYLSANNVPEHTLKRARMIKI